MDTATFVIFAMLMRLVIFICLLLGPAFALAQVNYVKMDHLNVNQGLPASICWKILKDEKGFMWIATDEGVARYDGIEFLVLRSEAGDTTSFESNSVKDMIMDRDGIIWAIAKNSLIRIDPSRLSAKRINHLPSGFSCPLKTVQRLTSVHEDNSGNLWLTSTYGIFFLDPQRQPVKHLMFHGSGEDETVNICNTMCFDDQGKAWVSHVSGLWVVDTTNWSYESLCAFPPQYRTAILSHRGSIWLAADSLYRIDPNNRLVRAIERSGFNGGWVRKLVPHHEDPEVIWCAFGSGGLASLNMTLGTFLVHSSDPGRSSVIPRAVHDIFHDGQKLWLATTTGTYIYDEGNENFAFHTGIEWNGMVSGIIQLFPDPVSSGPDVCTAITADGVFRWNPVTNETSRVKPYTDTKGHAIESINYRYVDTTGTEFISVGYKGVYACTDGRCELILADEEVEPGERDYMWYTSTVARDKQGTLWIAAESKLVRMGPEGKTFFTPPPVISSSGDTLMVKPSFREFIFDSSGIMWLVSEFSRQKHVIALYRFDTSTEKFTVFHAGNGMPDLANIFGITFDGHLIWCAGEGGVFRFDPTMITPQFEYVSPAHWLPSEMCNDVAADQQGRVWISTRNGLVCWSSDEDIRLFTETSGLIRNGNGQLVVTNGGYIVMPGYDSFNSFHPDRLPAIAPVQSPVITSILVNGKEISSELSAPWINRLVLPWFENTIHLNFSALQFNPGIPVEYSYFIEGISQDWVTTSTPSVTITNLPEGKRKISLRARVKGQPWSPHSTLEIDIATAWFRSWWFYSLLGLGVIAILYSIYRFRIRQILKVQEVKNRIASDLHDEVGSSLSSLALYADIMASKSLDENKRNQIVEKIRETASGSMESMRDIIWSARHTEEDLRHIIQRMERTGHDLMEGTSATFKLETKGNLDIKHLAPEWRKNMLLIFKESVNNARKYSGATLITARIATEKQRLTMEITDNGCGFDVQVTKRGNGLENIVRRAADIRGTAEIQSFPRHGTRIRISVPLF